MLFMCSRRRVAGAAVALSCGAALLWPLAGAQAAVPALDGRTNLIVNGDAEAGSAAGWTAYDGYALFSSVEYGPNWVQPTHPGPQDRGARLFVGGSGVAYAAGHQQVDLQSFASAIAAGGVRFDLRGWLGGWSDQGDNTQLWVQFLDGSGRMVGDVSLGPLTPGQRNNVTGLFLQQASGLLPAATRSLDIALTMQRLGGGDNDGYADNLSLTLSPIPEPATLALMLAGVLAVGNLVARTRERR